MKKILSLTLSAALLSAAAAPGYAINLNGDYGLEYHDIETAVNGKVDSSTYFPTVYLIPKTPMQMGQLPGFGTKPMAAVRKSLTDAQV